MQRSTHALMRIGKWMTIGLIFAVSTFATQSVSAQLPDEITGATTSLSASQRQRLTDFVDSTLEQFKSEDARESRIASRQLDSPLSRGQASRVFRIAYAQALAPKLSEIVESDDLPMHARLGSLLLLGALATDDVIPALSTALRSDLEAVRYNAALGYQRAFEVMRSGQQGFVDERQAARDMVRELRIAMNGEKSPYVFSALVSACIVSPDGPYALLNVCEGVESQLCARFRGEVPETMIGMYEIALERALKRYVTLLGANTELTESERALVRAGFAAMQLAVDAGKKDKIEDRFRQEYVDLVEAAQSLLDVVCGLSTRPNIDQSMRTAVLTAFKDANYDRARRVIDDFWLAPNGPIYGYRKLGIPAGSLDKILEGG